MPRALLLAGLLTVPFLMAACDDAQHTKLCSDKDFISKEIYPEAPKVISQHFRSNATDALGLIGAFAGALHGGTIINEVDRRSIKLVSAVPTTKVGKVYGCRMTVAASWPRNGDITDYTIPFDVEFTDPFGNNPAYSYKVDFDLMGTKSRPDPNPPAKAKPAPPPPPPPPPKTWEEKAEEGCRAADTLAYIQRSAGPFVRRHFVTSDNNYDLAKLERFQLPPNLGDILAGEVSVELDHFTRDACVYKTNHKYEHLEVEVILSMEILGEPPRPNGAPSIHSVVLVP